MKPFSHFLYKVKEFVALHFKSENGHSHVPFGKIRTKFWARYEITMMQYFTATGVLKDTALPQGICFVLYPIAEFGSREGVQGVPGEVKDVVGLSRIQEPDIRLDIVGLMDACCYQRLNEKALIFSIIANDGNGLCGVAPLRTHGQQILGILVLCYAGYAVERRQKFRNKMSPLPG